jgi:Mn-containing catalase
MGLVEEGQEVMAEGEKKEDAFAELALIGGRNGGTLRISGYTTAKNLAQQARHSAIVALLRNLWRKKKTSTNCSTNSAQPDVGCQGAGRYRKSAEEE